MLLWLLAALTLVAARWVDPPTTAVHVQRRLQAWVEHKPYHERYTFVPLNQISPDLQHAVIAAEDARFYQHHGFDWQAIETAAKDDMEGERTRGGSTLTQQLVKNLFFGTGRSYVRKGAEAGLVPVAEFLPGQAADSGVVPECRRVGPGCVWGGLGVAYLLPNAAAEDRPGTVGAAGGDSAGSAEAAARAHEQL